METPITLADWLAHCERLHPTAIDMGLERVRTVAQRMAIRFDCLAPPKGKRNDW